jgi:hypothetical protein
MILQTLWVALPSRHGRQGTASALAVRTGESFASARCHRWIAAAYAFVAMAEQ